MTDVPDVDAARVIADLRELHELTGGPGGARRVCWSAEWREARRWLTERLGELGVEPDVDEAGNLWARLEGERIEEPALALGSHIDSVPAGGWLDGALGVLAALGVLRAWAASGRRPPRSLVLVDFADEEGARFGRSLFGSSAFAGTLEPEELEPLRDRDGRSVADVLAEKGVRLSDVPRASARQAGLAAFLELHIEQGPVLEAEGLPVAAVTGCFGVERHRFAIEGQASHAGTTPMPSRRDAGLAAADAMLRIEHLPARHGGVATSGSVTLTPGIPTAVPGRAEVAVDLRHAEREALAAMLAGAEEAVRVAAAARDCRASRDPIWRIEPVTFDDRLVAAAAAACRRVCGQELLLASGALHDAAEVARVLPTVMLFAPSIGGISHAKEEDTREEDLAAAIEAFGALAGEALALDARRA